MYIFHNKGSNCDFDTGRLYTLDNFDRTYFTADWYRVYDKLGDSYELEFPVRMCSKLKWSAVVYGLDPSTSNKYALYGCQRNVAINFYNYNVLSS